MICPVLRALKSEDREEVHETDVMDVTSQENAPLMKSWVIEMRPKTLTWNMASKSASAMSPILSTPSTKPALFTARRPCVGRRANDFEKSRRTEDVNIAEILWDLVEERRDLLLVRDVQLNSREFASLLKARLLVRRCTRFRDRLQCIHATSAENHVRAALVRVGGIRTPEAAEREEESVP